MRWAAVRGSGLWFTRDGGREPAGGRTGFEGGQAKRGRSRSGVGSVMFAEERQQHIIDTARSAGRVDVSELSAALAVTTETIRRDLSYLERKGVLRRVHGGAMPVERSAVDLVVDDPPGGTTAAAAALIAKAALDELPDRGSVILSAGAATERLAEMLPADRPLIVVTNALAIASTVVVRPATTVVFVGGRIDRRSAGSVDSWALHQISQSFVEVAFIESTGVSLRRGLSEPDMANAAVKAAMMASARRTVLLADHARVGTDELVRYGELEDVDAIVTDPGLDERTAQRIAARGPRVICA
jgi:DeoR family transcriptional regulator, fructose operon transcriptional repressor